MRSSFVFELISTYISRVTGHLLYGQQIQNHAFDMTTSLYAKSKANVRKFRYTLPKKLSTPLIINAKPLPVEIDKTQCPVFHFIYCNSQLLFIFADDEVEEAEEAATEHLLDSSVVGRHAFTAMAGDHDRLTRQRLQRSPNEMHGIHQERV